MYTRLIINNIERVPLIYELDVWCCKVGWLLVLMKAYKMFHSSTVFFPVKPNGHVAKPASWRCMLKVDTLTVQDQSTSN